MKQICDLMLLAISSKKWGTTQEMKDRRAMLTVSNYKEFFRIGALTRFVTSWSYEIWNRTGYTSTISDWVPLWLKFSNWVSVLTTIVRWSTNASHLPRQDPHLCRLWPTSVRVRRFRSAALLNSCHAQHCFHCHLSFLPINEKQTTCSPCSSWRKSSHHLRSHHCTKKRIMTLRWTNSVHSSYWCTI